MLPAPGAEDAAEKEELKIRLTLGIVLIALHGYASVQAYDNFLRARDLSAKIGSNQEHFRVVRGLWNCVFDLAKLDDALRLANELSELSKGQPNTERSALALRALGTTHFNRGNFSAARQSLEMGASHCCALPDNAGIDEHGEAVAITLQCYFGWVYLILADIGGGLGASRQAFARAQALNHPVTIGFAGSVLGNMLVMVRLPAEARQVAKTAAAVCREHKVPFWLASAEVNAGLAIAHGGSPAEGIERARKGLLAWESTGAVLHVPTYSMYVAETCLLANDLDGAETELGRALTMARRNKEHFVLAEALRLKASLSVRQGHSKTAQALLAEAIDVARKQGARWFELLATRDLARLSGQTAMVKRLAVLMQSMDTGLTLSDLAAARAVLAELDRA